MKSTYVIELLLCFFCAQHAQFSVVISRFILLGDSMQFSLAQSAWWQEWYVYVCCVMVLGWLIYLRLRLLRIKSILKTETENYDTKVDLFSNICRDACTHLSLIDARLEKAFWLLGDDQMARHHLGQARNNSEQLIQLLNGFLDYQNVETRTSGHNGNSDGQTLFPLGSMPGNCRFFPNEASTDKAVSKHPPDSYIDIFNKSGALESGEKHYTILHIMHNDGLKAFESELLSRTYEVIKAANGRDGLQMAFTNNPDLILCDVLIPEQDGIQICSGLKADPRTAHIPIILMAGQSTLHQVIQGLRAGADDYLVQPVDVNILLLKIQYLIKARTALRSINENGLSSGSDEWLGSDANDEFIEKLRSLLIQNISQPNFGVNELAFQVGMSVSVLYRKVRSLTGMTVNDFMKNVKMQRALQFLESGTYQVSEVALMVGYESVRYFSNEFKKIHGKNPSKVRSRSGE